MKKPSILKIMTVWILVLVFTAFVVSTIAFYVFTTIVSKRNSEQLLANNIEDLRLELVEADSIVFTSNAIATARNFEKVLIDNQLTDDDIQSAFVQSANQSEVPELFYVDSTGCIRSANLTEKIGFDMRSNDVSRPFLRLLSDDGKPNVDSSYVTPLLPKGIFGDAPRKYIAGRFTETKGFIVVGMTESRVNANLDFMLSNSAHYRRVGERGRIFIFNSSLQIISAPITCQEETIDKVGIDKEAMNRMPEQTLFEATILGERCLCYHSYLMGYHMLAVQPCSESTYNRDAALKSRTITGSLVFGLLFLVLWLIVRRLVRNIKRINTSLEMITAGNLDERVNVDDTIEFQLLSDHTNKMVDRLKEYIHEAEDRIAADLALARDIQSSTLPSVFPAFPDRQEFDIHAVMKTAREVGGDFYDFFFVGENKLAIVIADVAGKGIPAAMFMMRSKSALKNQASTGQSLEQVCYEVNNMLCQENETHTFFTCWIGVVDLKTGLLTYVNAGHNLPLVRRKGGAFSFLECQPNIPMAAFEDFQYQVQTLQFNSGDEIFLYTDGVTEATSTSLELFGDDRLLQLFNSMPADVATTSRSICLNTLQEVQRFAVGAEQSDDMTMLSFKYN